MSIVPQRDQSVRLIFADHGSFHETRVRLPGEALARYERSDVCAVPAAAVVGEAVVAWELAGAFLEKFGGDTVADMEKAVEAYAARLR